MEVLRHDLPLLDERALIGQGAPEAIPAVVLVGSEAHLRPVEGAGRLVRQRELGPGVIAPARHRPGGKEEVHPILGLVCRGACPLVSGGDAPGVPAGPVEAVGERRLDVESGVRIAQGGHGPAQGPAGVIGILDVPSAHCGEEGELLVAAREAEEAQGVNGVSLAGQSGPHRIRLGCRTGLSRPIHRGVAGRFLGVGHRRTTVVRHRHDAHIWQVHGALRRATHLDHVAISEATGATELRGTVVDQGDGLGARLHGGVPARIDGLDGPRPGQDDLPVARSVLFVLEQDDHLGIGIEVIGHVRQGKSTQLRRQSSGTLGIQGDRRIGRARDLYLWRHTVREGDGLCAIQESHARRPEGKSREGPLERYGRCTGVHVRPGPLHRKGLLEASESAGAHRAAGPHRLGQSGHIDRRSLTTIEGHGRRTLQRHGARRFRPAFEASGQNHNAGDGRAIDEGFIDLGQHRRQIGQINVRLGAPSDDEIGPLDQPPHGPTGIRSRSKQEILQADGRGPEIRVGGIESERKLERQQLTRQRTASLDGVDGIVRQESRCGACREKVGDGLGGRERPRHPFRTSSTERHTLGKSHIEQGLQGARRVAPRTFIRSPASLRLGSEVADLDDTVFLGLTEQNRGDEEKGEKQGKGTGGHGPCTRMTPVRFHPLVMSSQSKCIYVY